MSIQSSRSQFKKISLGVAPQIAVTTDPLMLNNFAVNANHVASANRPWQPCGCYWVNTTEQSAELFFDKKILPNVVLQWVQYILSGFG